MKEITIIGAGLSGLSAALTLAENGYICRLVSAQASERAQSVLAEGGINAALDVMGEQDTTQEHFEDTMRGGVDLADPNAVRGLTENAPALVLALKDLGVPFTMDGEKLIQRNFGGQKKKRTAYCKSSTGKALMTAMIDAVRRYEGTLITRYPHHVLEELMTSEAGCGGVCIRDTYTGQRVCLEGPVILAFGGPAGIFPGLTTGTTTNDGNGLALVFSQGVAAADLEFIQYHPTTVSISGKRMLISEAARGEGGRLYIMRGGERWYFMEEKYPQLGNLMPRDVVSREMAAVAADPACEDQVYLDLTVLPAATWKKKLPDLREEVRHYLGIDPAKTPVPVSPGIHFFMGGIDVDEGHRTSMPGVYAAGECACQYHGANRLGGNSLLGAIYGGHVAAQTLLKDLEHPDIPLPVPSDAHAASYGDLTPDPDMTEKVMQVLTASMGITRNGDALKAAAGALSDLESQTARAVDLRRIRLAKAMVLCALAREESRGAHQRSDFPGTDERFRRKTVAKCLDGEIQITFSKIQEERR